VHLFLVIFIDFFIIMLIQAFKSKSLLKYLLGDTRVKFIDLIDEDVFAQGQKIGVVKDVYIDSEKWEITHFEIQLTKEAAFEILGAKTPIRNSLSISALRKGTACCTDKGIEIKFSKAQLHIYLRPPE